MKLRHAALLGLTCFLVSCNKYDEQIVPIYPAENLVIGDAHIELWQPVGKTKVEPSLIRRVAREIVGWLPGVGDLLELPLDLTSVLIPPLSSVSHPALPKDAEWDDPRLLEMIKSFKIGSGFLQTMSRAEEEPGKVRESCPFWRNCREERPDGQFDEFLKEIRIYLTFSKLKTEGLDQDLPAETETLLASADVSKDYQPQTRQLVFRVTDINLKPFLKYYGDISVKVVSRGNYPKNPVQFDGQFRLDIDLKLSGQ